MHKAERGKLGTESVSHTFHKNTKISHTSTAQFEEERKINFEDKGKFNHIKEKKIDVPLEQGMDDDR
jgi:hypothetical protein